MDEPALLALLQFADGLFPAGAFAHSLGLETYVQDGRVRSTDDLGRFVAAHLEGATGPADAVAVALAARAAAADDETLWAELDARLDAMKAVPEFRAASRQMGRETARVAAALGNDPLLRALACRAEAGAPPVHHAVAFGAATGRSGVGPQSAATAFLYSTATLLTGAALRLLPLGQVAAQRVIAAQRERITKLATAAARASVDDMWSFAPALELAGLRHATLDRRLFRS